MEYRLKPEIIELIRKDGALYGLVAQAMGITVPSLEYPLRKNSDDFTKKAVLKAISKHTGIAESELVEEITEPENA